MAVLFGLIILGLVLACLILPWINLSKIGKLRREMAQLRRDMAELRMSLRRPADEGAAQSRKSEVRTDLAEDLDHAEPASAPDRSAGYSSGRVFGIGG